MDANNFTAGTGSLGSSSQRDNSNVIFDIEKLYILDYIVDAVANITIKDIKK